MQTIGIKDLQTNPAVLTRSLAANDYTMITKRNKPIGIAIPFNDHIINDGLKVALMIDAYKKSYLSLGQLSKALALDKKKTLNLLSLMNIDVIDYEFEDDMKFIDGFL